VGHFGKTPEEREQVVPALKMGIDGPFSFGETCWEKPSVHRGNR